jgi:8-oxo-dGTP pyrophosphatase MutT (NUDIX family)
MTEKNITKLIKDLTQPLPGRSAQFQMAPSFRHHFPDKTSPTQAGVLLLLYPNPIELHLVLIKRAEYLGTHSGQISFPGGKFESADFNIQNTALREAEEEIGIAGIDVKVLGQLTPLYIPVSEFEVFPVVGFVPRKPSFILDKNEVQYIIEVEVNFLLNPLNKAIKPFSNDKYKGDIPYFNIQGNEVWGATAMILNEFLEIVKLLFGN